MSENHREPEPRCLFCGEHETTLAHAAWQRMQAEHAAHGPDAPGPCRLCIRLAIEAEQH